jgi:methyltransferase (TIGR00027 family)
MAELIEHVSDTAFWVAYYRWVETQRPDALFKDPLSIKLVGDRGAKLAKHMGIERAMAWSMALRTWIIDRYIMEGVAHGCDGFVNLGAGLDTRPYRLDLAADFQWIEVDFPHVIDYKNETLKDETPVCRLRRIACDLSDDTARVALLSELNAIGGNLYVLTEGVVPYLTNEQVAALARDLHQQDNIRHWITDYFSPFFLKIGARSKLRKRLAQNAPFRFNPGPKLEDWPAFFARTGWSIEEMRFSGEEGKRIGRGLPAGWLGQLLMPLASDERLRPYRRMNGFALLKKGSEIITL